MKRIVATALVTAAAITGFAQVTPASQMEKIDRAPVALPAIGGGEYVGWRVLGTDAPGLSFSVERDGKIIAKDLMTGNYTDRDGSAESSYRILCSSDTTEAIRPWGDIYKSVPISRPGDGYTPNDCSVGDVDGDGKYELILKWDPRESHDNAHDGNTGDVIIDCYRLDGTLLWRVNLGCNIRAGAHYTQFLVYDFDGDGRAEMICKTAPGSVDGKGRFVSEAATDKEIRKTDNKKSYVNSRGRILSGPEYLTVFEGLTGKALHTVYYNPNRAFSVGGSPGYSTRWGDENGNRGERFLACVAYLDGPGKRPSAVMCRGYYTQSHLWAVDFDGKALSTKWLHASYTPHDWKVTDGSGSIIKEAHDLSLADPHMSATAFGQGAHSLAVADVDGDGADEITYGSAAIDNDGALLYSTGMGHGDAIHLGDLDPDRPGLEVYMVHEHYPFGASLRDARTGEVLWRITDKEDTGRGVSADIDADHRGCEMWCSAGSSVYDIHGEEFADAPLAMNFRIYWDGDLQEELVANQGPRRFVPFLQKWNGKSVERLPLGDGRQIYEVANSASCNWSKATPNLQADILGDWREELIYWDSSDAEHLNIFTTNYPTEYRVPALMHDHVYRMGVALQNVTYNQPPHLGYYLPDRAVKAGR